MDQAELHSLLTQSRSPVAFVDFCWSPHKSVSLAWALAPTAAEGAIIQQAHRESVDFAMAYLERVIGQARRGKAGRGGAERGSILWLSIDHYAARPTISDWAIDSRSGEDPWVEGGVEIEIEGDPQLHSHVVVPNVVLTASGHVGGLDLARLAGRIEESGFIYHARLATNLRRAGVAVSADPSSGRAIVDRIPQELCELFSKRSQDGGWQAREYASRRGLNWDELPKHRRVAMRREAIQGETRLPKADDWMSETRWRLQAKASSWHPATVITQSSKESLHPSGAAIQTERYLQRLFAVQERLTTEDIRIGIARCLVLTGTKTFDDIDLIPYLLGYMSEIYWRGNDAFALAQDADGRGEPCLKLVPYANPKQESALLDAAQRAAQDLLPQHGNAEGQTLALPPNVLWPAEEEGADDHAARIVHSGCGLTGVLHETGLKRQKILASLVAAWKQRGRRAVLLARREMNSKRGCHR